MVTKYGMSSKLGPMTFGDSEEEVFLGNSIGSKRNYSEEVAFEIDNEIKDIVDVAYKKTKKLLQDNMDSLEYVAQALLVYETLDADQFIKAFNKELPLDVKSENATTEEVVDTKEEKIDLSKDINKDQNDDQIND